MRILMHRFLRSEDGTTAIEYGLIAALICTVIVGSILALGQGIVNVLYTKIAAAFS